MRLAPILLVLSIVTACGPSRVFLKEARVAAEGDDWERAYRAYDHVLDRKPTHPEALTGRRESQRRVLEVVDAEIQAALARNELDRVDGALELAARVDASEEWVRPRRRAWMDAWTRTLDESRADAAQRGALGDAYAYAWGMESLTGSAQHSRVRQEAWAALRGREFASVRLDVRGAGRPGMTERVVSSWESSPWSQVPMQTTGSSDWMVGVRVDEDACVQEVVGRRQAVHDYRDGTFVPNPRVRELQSELQDAGRAWDAAEAARLARQREEDRAFAKVEDIHRQVNLALPELQATDRTAREAAKERERASRRLRRSEDAVAGLQQLEDRRRKRRVERDALERDLRVAQSAHQGASVKLQRAAPRLQALERDLELAKQVHGQAEQADAAARETHAQATSALKIQRERLEARELEPVPRDVRLEPVKVLEARLEELEADRDRKKLRMEGLKQELAAAEAAGDPAVIDAVKTKISRVRPALKASREALQSGRDELLQARFRRARGARRQAAKAVEAAAAELQTARVTLDAIRPQTRAARAQGQSLVSELAALDQQIQRLQARKAQLRDEGLADRAQRDQLMPLAQDLNLRAQELSRLERTLQVAVHSRDRLQGIVDQLAASQAHLERLHAQAQERRVQAVDVVRGWSERGQELQVALDAEPDRVELVKQAGYTVTRHRRTCVVTGQVSVQSPRTPGHSEPVAVQHVVEDDTHSVNPRIRLKEDPLDFGSADSAVLSSLRDQAAASVLAVVGDRWSLEADSRRGPASGERDRLTRDAVIAEFLRPTGDLAKLLVDNYALPPIDR